MMNHPPALHPGRPAHRALARRAHARRAPLAMTGLAIACLLILSGPVGCMKARVGGATPPDVVIDELRLENVALQRQVQDLQKQIDLRLAQIDTLNQQAQAGQAHPSADTPRAVKLAFGRYSGLLDTDGDKRPDVARVYLTPRDQRDRLLPVTGQATLQVIALPAQGQPVQVAVKTFTAVELDAAYRSGLTGTHYTLEVALPDPLPALSKGLATLTVQVSLTDAATGATLQQQQAMPLR